MCCLTPLPLWRCCWSLSISNKPVGLIFPRLVTGYQESSGWFWYVFYSDPLLFAKCVAEFIFSGKIWSWGSRGVLRKEKKKQKKTNETEGLGSFIFNEFIISVWIRIKHSAVSDLLLLPQETICMDCQMYFLGKNKINTINLSSAAFARRVVQSNSKLYFMLWRSHLAFQVFPSKAISQLTPSRLLSPNPPMTLIKTESCVVSSEKVSCRIC